MQQSSAILLLLPPKTDLQKSATEYMLTACLSYLVIFHGITAKHVSNVGHAHLPMF